MTQTIQLAQTATELDIAAALKALKTTGGVLVMPKDATIAITKTMGITVESKDITIDLNGSKLVGTGSNSLLYVEGKESALTSASIGTQGGNATITYSKLPSDISVGSWIKVVADDALPADHVDPGDNGQPTRLGQAAEVIAINGDTVVLRGSLLEQDLYQTNIRTMTYATGNFTLKNGTLDGKTGDYLTSSNATDLVQIRNLVEPTVQNLKVLDGGTGVKIVNSVNAEIIDITAKNVGAGIYAGTSLGTNVNGLFVEHANHGVIVHGVGIMANESTASRYGANIGLEVTNAVVYDASKSAYDTHSESRNTLYEDVLAFDSRMLASFRGIGNSIKDSAGAGNSFALQFYEYGKGDGRDAVVDNVAVRETANYNFIISANPLNNKITNSSFESYGVGYRLLDTMVSVVGSTIKEKVVGIDDIMIGTSAADKLLGGQGSDLIDGGGGNDYVWGGAGVDILTGGAGRDRFAYNAVSEGGDIIRDFQAGASGDLIDVSVLAARYGWGAGNPIAEGHVRATALASHTIVQATGLDGVWTTLATLENVAASTFTAANVQWQLSDPTGASGAAASSAAAPVASAPIAVPVVTAPAPVVTSPPVKAAPEASSFAFVKSDGSAKAGETVTIAVTFNEAVRVEGSGLKLELNSGGVATYAYGTGRDTLYFTYKIEPGQNASELDISKILLGTATVRSVGSGIAIDPVAHPTRSGDKLVVDTAAPTTQPIVLTYEDSGAKNDALTNATAIKLSGIADAGSRVQVFDGTRSLGSTTAGTDGKWQFDAKWLADGQHSFTAVETDVAGNKGVASAAAVVTTDTKGPGRASMDGAYTATATNLTDVPMSGRTEALAHVDIYDNGTKIGSTKADASGVWTFRTDDLGAGSHRMTVVASDQAGNMGSVSAYRDIVVDHTAPELALRTLALTNTSGGVQFRGTVNETPSEILVYDEGKLVSSISTKYASWAANIIADPDKVHTFSFAAKDAAGNLGKMDGVAVLGTKGNNLLTGTAHDDIFTGNSGTDTFLFKGDVGKDIITDFKAGALSKGGDILKFDHSLAANFSDFMSDARQVGADVVVTFDDHNSITLQRTTLSALTHENVLFV